MSYGGFRRNDNFGPKPVETGKEYDVQITEVSRKGKVGQNAKIRVVQVGNRFATAEIVEGATAASSSTTASEPTTS